MDELMTLKRVASFPISEQTLPQLPQNLLGRFAEETLKFVHPSDFEMFLEDFADEVDEPVEFTHESFGPDDLAHPIVPLLLDPDAFHLDYVRIERTDEPNLHLVVAKGGNAMGFVVDDEGVAVAEIYDWVVREPGSQTYTQDAFGAAIRLMWLYASEGQTVADLKQTYLEKESEAAKILFPE